MEYYNFVKNVNKGSDMAVFSVQSNNGDKDAVQDISEIGQNQAVRCISSSGTVWQVLSFPLRERNPPVHLKIKKIDKGFISQMNCTKTDVEEVYCAFTNIASIFFVSFHNSQPFNYNMPQQNGARYN